MTARRLGIYAAETQLGRPDGRTRAGRMLRVARAALIDALGGEEGLNLPQRALVDRAVALQFRLAIMDRDLVAGAPISGHGAREYVAASNALVKILGQLGLAKPPAPEPPAKPDPMAAIRELERQMARDKAA
jgi:hypothetical protein